MRDEGVIGVGYEGQSIEDFVAGLVRWRVATVVDVRLNAISRKRGFSKRALTAALLDGGIRYLHLPQLGNPRENRAAYSSAETSEGLLAREMFDLLLESDPARAALTDVARLAANERVAVMCFEASELHCHRREVLSALRARTDDLIAV